MAKKSKKNQVKDSIKESPLFKGMCVLYIIVAFFSGYFSIMYYGEGTTDWPVNPTLYTGVLGVLLFAENMGVGILGLMWKKKPSVIPNVCLGLVFAEIAYTVVCMIINNGLQTGLLLPILMIIGIMRQKKYIEDYNIRQMYRRGA